MTEDERVVDSLNSADGLYCIDVIEVDGGFLLQTCRRDEGRWQVLRREGTYGDRSTALAKARDLVAGY